jgi:hypothetical protein
VDHQDTEGISGIKKQVIQKLYVLHSDVDNDNHVMAVVINQVESFRRTFFVGDLGLPKEEELIWATLLGPVLSGCKVHFIRSENIDRRFRSLNDLEWKFHQLQSFRSYRAL